MTTAYHTTPSDANTLLLCAKNPRPRTRAQKQADRKRRNTRRMRNKAISIDRAPQMPVSWIAVWAEYTPKEVYNAPQNEALPISAQIALASANARKKAVNPVTYELINERINDDYKQVTTIEITTLKTKTRRKAVKRQTVIDSPYYNEYESAAKTAVNTVYKKCPTDDMRRLVDGMRAPINGVSQLQAALNNPYVTLPVCADTVQECGLSILQSYHKRNQYMQDWTWSEYINDAVPGELINRKRIAMRAANRMISGEKHGKGRKVITQAYETDNGACKCYNLSMPDNVTMIESAPYIEYERAYPYNVDSYDAMRDTNPDKYELSQPSYYIQSRLDELDAIEDMTALISAKDIAVFDLLIRECYTQAEIASMLYPDMEPQAAKNKVCRAVRRIRETIANSGQYDGVRRDAVKAYKTV